MNYLPFYNYIFITLGFFFFDSITVGEETKLYPVWHSNISSNPAVRKNKSIRFILEVRKSPKLLFF